MLGLLVLGGAACAQGGAPSIAKSAAPWSVKGTVTKVVDGDTLHVVDGAQQLHKIRIAGIDTPERGQPHVRTSRAHLARLVDGRPVSALCHKRDQYRREICVVLAGGADVGLEQVRAGMAWWFERFADEQSVDDRRRYERAQAAARGARLGLWRDPDPIPPWDWRSAARAR